MNRMFAAPLFGLLALALSALAPASAHEGHDHGAPPPLPKKDVAPRAEASSDAFELTAVARDGVLTIYLDRFATNEPLQDATIEVETPQGPVTAEPASPDPHVGRVWRLKADWAKPGQYDLIFTVGAGDAVDVLSTTLVIPAPPASPEAALSTAGASLAHDLRQRLAKGDLATGGAAFAGFLFGAGLIGLGGRKRAAWIAIAAFATIFAVWGVTQGAKAAEAGIAQRDLPQRLPDGSVFVPKSTQRILALRTVLGAEGDYRRSVEWPGRVIADPNAAGFVQASAGGRLSPPPGGFPRLGARVEKGDVLAYVTAPLQAIDVSTLRQQAGDLDQQISIMERRVARFEQLARSGSATQTQLEESRLELSGLKQRRAALDHVRREPEALIAPVSGVIAEANAVAGQIVQPSERVFHIVDPARLWVEALSFEADTGEARASARLSSGRALALKWVGAGLADRNQAIPIHFAITGDTQGLRIGQFVTVLKETQDAQKGFALPRASLVRAANGQQVVYEHVSAERFEAREVRVEPFDADRVLVLSGVGAGRRIVTQGAELIDQIR